MPLPTCGGLEGAGSKLAVTTQEPGGEAAMEELISPITTTAGKKKKSPRLSSPSHRGSEFSTPLARWSEGPSLRLLWTSLAQMRVCMERGWPLQAGCPRPLVHRGNPLLPRVNRYPRMHPKAELCFNDFYPLNLPLLRDTARPRSFHGGAATRQWRRCGEAERTADQSQGPAHHWGMPLLARGTPVLEGNNRSASPRLPP